MKNHLMYIYLIIVNVDHITQITGIISIFETKLT